MFWLLPRLMIITGTESYFLRFKPRRPLLGLAAFIQAFYKETFLRPLLTAVYLAYIPITVYCHATIVWCVYFPLRPGVCSELTFNWENTVSPNRIRRCLDFLKVTSRRDCFLGGMKILTPGRSQNTVYSQRIILVPSTRKTLFKDFPSWEKVWDILAQGRS